MCAKFRFVASPALDRDDHDPPRSLVLSVVGMKPFCLASSNSRSRYGLLKWFSFPDVSYKIWSFQKLSMHHLITCRQLWNLVIIHQSQEWLLWATRSDCWEGERSILPQPLRSTISSGARLCSLPHIHAISPNTFYLPKRIEWHINLN